LFPAADPAAILILKFNSNYQSYNLIVLKPFFEMRQFFEIMESFDSLKAILGTLIQQANVYSIFYKSFEPCLSGWDRFARWGNFC
jgi:hypothetical protein